MHAQFIKYIFELKNKNSKSKRNIILRTDQFKNENHKLLKKTPVMMKIE